MATKKATPKKKTSTARKTVSTKSSVKPQTTVTTKTVATEVKKQRFSESITELPFWRTLAAEFIGTFILAATFIVSQGQPLYIFFAFVGIFLLFGATSGAYANPALAVAAWVGRRITWIRALGYVIFEVLGALVALWVLHGFVGAAGTSATGSATTLYQATTLASGKELYVFFAELVGTLILGFAFANAHRVGQERLTSAFTAGIGLFMGLMFAFIASSYASGTAILNPAVAASLNALSWKLWPLAAYILAPVIGAIAGFFLNDFVKGRSVK